MTYKWASFVAICNRIALSLIRPIRERDNYTVATRNFLKAHLQAPFSSITYRSPILKRHNQKFCNTPRYSTQSRFGTRTRWSDNYYLHRARRFLLLFGSPLCVGYLLPGGRATDNDAPSPSALLKYIIMAENTEIQHENSFALLNSDDYLSEQDLIENEMEVQQQENLIEQERPENELSRPIIRGRMGTKRTIETDEDEWTAVKPKEKKLNNQDIEMYISCSEKIPKLFALAKIFKTHCLTDIVKIKFVNPFKVRVDVSNEECAAKLETCQELIDKGWRIHRAMEKNLSFGVIKNVDIDMEDEEILKSITSPEKAELLSIYRLKRRCIEEDGWKVCESVRLCFKGSFLPNHVMVDGMRIRVDPYVFPVSQCAKCWKLGHVTKRCPSNKVICPKCAGDHANCESKSYRCVNCNGRHMAMTKSCPSFVKEKKLRDLMAEFNCTYRRALTMYVSPSHHEPQQPDNKRYKETERSSEYLRNLFPEYCQPSVSTPTGTSTFADVTKTKAALHEENKRQTAHRFTKKQPRRPSSPFNWSEEPADNRAEGPKEANDLPTDETNSERTSNIWELLKRLKNIIFLRGATIQAKVKMVIKCCVECLVSMCVNFIPDWPILQTIIDYFCQDG